LLLAHAAEAEAAGIERDEAEAWAAAWLAMHLPTPAPPENP
jgi:hypothetical protein